MSTLQAIVFGLVQGMTEFLPVSSSGHLALMKQLFDLENLSILFDILLHVATLLAVIIVFRLRLYKIILSLLHLVRGRLHNEDRQNLRFVILIIVASTVTAILGISIDAATNLTENITAVSIFFIVTACTLIGTAQLKPGVKKYDDIGVKEFLLIGLCQGLGVFPGISRSGITISTALAIGLKREDAGELSFILFIPTVLGALLLKLPELGDLSMNVEPSSILLGMVMSFVSGLIVLVVLMRLIRMGGLFYFAFYLIPLGIISLILF